MASKLRRDEKTVSARLDERTRYALEWIVRATGQTTVAALTHAIHARANTVYLDSGSQSLHSRHCVEDEFPDNTATIENCPWELFYDALEPLRVLRPIMFRLWRPTPDEHLLRDFVTTFSNEVGWEPRDRQRLARTWPLQELASDWSNGELTDAQVRKELERRAKAAKTERA